MQAQIPSVIYDYFGAATIREHGHPLIAQSFVPGKGWKGLGFNKRVSHSWLRKLKAKGATHVAVDLGGRRADFSLAEIDKAARRPMFGSGTW